MKKLIPIMITVGLLSCSWFSKPPEYTPLQICTTICSLQAVVDAVCMEPGNELWEMFQNVYDTTECMIACDKSYFVFEHVSPACLADLYLSLGPDEIGCPDLQACMVD